MLVDNRTPEEKALTGLRRLVYRVQPREVCPTCYGQREIIMSLVVDDVRMPCPNTGCVAGLVKAVR